MPVAQVHVAGVFPRAELDEGYPFLDQGVPGCSARLPPPTVDLPD